MTGFSAVTRTRIGGSIRRRPSFATGAYADLSGLFAVSGAASGRKAVGQDAAETPCKVGAANGIDCKVVALPGKHDWPTAATAFEMTLPWLAERIDLPAVTSAAVP